MHCFLPFFGDIIKTSKIIKTPKVFVLCIIIGMMVVPLVSAKGDATKSGRGPAVDDTDREYIVSPSTADDSQY